MQPKVSVSRFHPALTALAVRGARLSPNADLAELKVRLAEFGINQRGWRMVTKFGDALLNPIAEDGRSAPPEAAFRNFCAFIRLVQQCEMDIPPPPELVRVLFALLLPRGRSLADLPVGLFRAAWSRAVALQYQGNDLEGFIESSLPDVLRWHFESGHESAPQTPREWRWYEDLAQHWTQRCAHELSFDEWPALLKTPVESRGVMAVELLDVESLSDEGTAMNHCVGAYFPLCDDNEYRVFSLRKRATGERVATLGITLDERWWVIDQVRGPNNDDVPAWIRDLARFVVMHCNRREDGPVATRAQRSLFPEHKVRAYGIRV